MADHATEPPLTQTIGQRLRDVRARISDTARFVGRDPRDIALIAVSKTQTSERIMDALDAGHRVFGENRVQESQDKWPGLKDAYPETELHLIGSLQSNKVRDAIALFDVIQTVDRDRLAQAIARESDRCGKRPQVYLQVNTGEEVQKSGVLPIGAEDFVMRCREEYGLDVVGLMCIPPVDEEPGLHFAMLRTIAERVGLTKLSMGMSHDYDIAVQFGATAVRVGTAIFGPRLQR